MTSNSVETDNGPRSRGPKIIVLTGGSSGSRYALQQLEQCYEIHTVVRENISRLRVSQRLYRRSKKLGWFYLLDRLSLLVYSRLFLSCKANSCDEYRRVQQAAYTHRPKCAVITVDSINDQPVIDVLTKEAPNLVVVLGTSIIRKPVLAAAKCFVNLHSGITPLYRGAHGAFWATMAGDATNAGVTLHYVDSGIDTGGILKQTTIHFAPESDNVLTLAAKSTVASAELLTDWIRECDGNFTEIPTQQPPAGESCLHYSPGLLTHLRFEQMAKQLARKSDRAA